MVTSVIHRPNDKPFRKVASYPTKRKNTSDCAVIWRKLWWFDCFHLQSLFSFEWKLLCICSSAYTSLEITIIAMGSKKEVFHRSKLAMENLFLEIPSQWFTSKSDLLQFFPPDVRKTCRWSIDFRHLSVLDIQKHRKVRLQHQASTRGCLETFVLEKWRVKSSPEGNFFRCEPRVERHVNGEIVTA